MEYDDCSADCPDSSVVEAFAEIPSAVASDVIEGGRRTMAADISPVCPDVRMAGSAVTVEVQAGDNLLIHKAITLAEPDDILVIDGQEYMGAALAGEMICYACKVHDLAGLVVDGAVRDRAEIRELGFPVYARGFQPEGPSKGGAGSVNDPISCGGVGVEPGDVIVGDEDGVTVVPADSAEDILRASREKLEQEANAREAISNGTYPMEIGGYDELLEEN